MATQSKTQYLADLQAYLKRRYKPKAEPASARLSVIDAVVYGICHEDTTREQANQALSRFKDQFVDWNEVRVSPLEELQETLADVPDPAARAQRIRRFLRQLFEKTYSFTALEQLAKKPLKEALKTLQPFEAFHSDYVTATVVHQALGGHAIPIDEATRKALESLGLHEPDVASLRGLIERAIPKNRGAEFVDLLEELARDAAVATDPKAPRWEHAGKPAKPGKEAAAAPAKEAKAKEKDKAREKEAPPPAPEPAPKAKKSPPKEEPPTPPKKGGGKGKPGGK
ncbi:endonuclease [Paludisphaera soli]|uniref:endonuclease n=1 Tax=Paludisphaera soli TaxID=2712865 RepID=UPI0013ED0E71|nr:endonuclease [Paludisphaera soli]